MKTHVHLRDVQAGDLALFFAHQQDPEAAAMAAFQSRDADAFAQHWAKLLRDDTCRKQTIIVSSTGSASPPAEDHVAGNIGSWNSDGEREVGYWIDRAYWGRGVATAALSAFLRLEQIRPLHAGVAKHNAGSLRVLLKCGFTLLPIADPTHLLLVRTEAD